MKHLEDCIIDSVANTITYHFTQTETLNLLPKQPLNWQLRLVMDDGEIVGTQMAQILISDLISSEVLQ